MNLTYIFLMKWILITFLPFGTVCSEVIHSRDPNVIEDLPFVDELSVNEDILSRHDNWNTKDTTESPSISLSPTPSPRTSYPTLPIPTEKPTRE